MTVNNSANKVIAAGNGAQSVFDFAFIAVNASDLTIILTNSSGIETTLLPAQYSVALNPTLPGQIWSIGGTVTYPLTGSPIPAGSTLTIVRELSLTQLVALSNQGNEFPSAVETAIDLIEMQLQQVSEMFQRAIVAPVVDSSAPLPLPPAAQRANQGMAFDANGNPIAAALPASGVISTVMQPVVDAATLAAGRAAFGLGGMATEGIGAGLQDDGAGNARVDWPLVSDATNQTVTAAFHLNQRIGTGPIIYSLPRANTLFDGFGFWLYAVTGDLTITPNANDSFRGLSSGTSIAVPQGSWAFITTDAANTGTWYARYNNENLHITAGVSANALTISINATALKFRDPTFTSGDPLWQNMPANLSVTVPNGATLGTANGVPCRVWLFACHNGGTPVLGVALGSIPGHVFPLAAWETQAVAGTLIGTGSGSAGKLYSATAFSSDSVRLIGYVEFANGQAVAGTWASAPTAVQSMGAGVKKPGDVVQAVVAATGSASASIAPTSSANLVKVTATGTISLGSTGIAANTTITRNGSGIGLNQGSGTQTTSFATFMPVAITLYDAPETTNSTVYFLSTSNGNLTGVVMIAEEIMG